MVFPEGTKGTGKTYSERYQLRRFGRGGFVQIAMRSGVPIIPMSVIGSEETMPIVFKLPTLARALRVPYFPVTANMLALGPLRLLFPFPPSCASRCSIPSASTCPRPAPVLAQPGHGRLGRSARRSRDSIYDMLRKRRGVWSG